MFGKHPVKPANGSIIGSMKNYDAILIGGGIIGCSIARSLALGGFQVAIVEKGQLGQEASWAAAGMLSPSAEADVDSPLFPLCRASLKLYAPLSTALKSETGIDSEYRNEGTLLAFRDDTERGSMLPSIEWQRGQGIAIEELSALQLNKREPQLANCAGAFFLAEDHQIDNRLLMKALIESCRRRGVNFILGQEVRDVQCNNLRVTGVATDAGFIAATYVINTAGAWAGALNIQGLAPVVIRPVKGHVVALANQIAPIQHVVRTHSTYLVPRKNGTVIVGSTMEEAAFDKTVHASSIRNLIQAANRLCPTLEQSKVSETWTGLRPASPDGLPILGPTPVDGYWIALGHFRNGILLAPITAQILSSWIISGSPTADIEAFKFMRFRD